jgi:hypothetical protein
LVTGADGVVVSSTWAIQMTAAAPVEGRWPLAQKGLMVVGNGALTFLCTNEILEAVGLSPLSADSRNEATIAGSWPQRCPGTRPTATLLIS